MSGWMINDEWLRWLGFIAFVCGVLRIVHQRFYVVGAGINC